LVNIPANTIQNSLYLSEATDEVVSEIIKKRKDSKKSPGFDQIRMNDLVAMIDHNVSLITQIENNSLNTSVIPKQLKFSVVRPIFKSGDAKRCNNYRPVAILCSIDKVIEDFFIIAHAQLPWKF